jgi:tetratricopeptide (TPR) repeat protein
MLEFSLHPSRQASETLVKSKLVLLALPILFMLSSLDAHAQVGVARGQVVDELGDPVEDVNIEFEFLSGKEIRYTTATSKRGRYTQSLAAGTYRVTASKEGYRGTFVEFEVKGLDPTTIPELEITNRERAQNARMAPILEKFNRAGELTRTGQLDDAQALLEQLAAEQPQIPEVHFNLGTIHSQRQEWDAAEAAFRRTLELQPDSVPAGMALSSVYESSGRVDEAIATRAGVAEANPKDAEVHYSLALLYLNAQRMDDAQASLQRVAALEPEKADVYYLLASVALNKGELAESVPLLERYLEVADESGAYRTAVTEMLPALRKAAEESSAATE